MPSVDISMIGDKALEKLLVKLVDKTQKQIVRAALRKEAKSVKDRIVANIAHLGLIKTGRMIAGYAGAKIKSAGGKKNFIRIGVEDPTRDQLGISPNDKYYYPYALEYGGGNGPATPFIRPAVDEHKTQSMRDIGQNIGAGIIREAKKGKA